jgi:hypothetical protein
LYGLVGGFIGGGASAGATGISQVVIDPMHSDALHLFKLMFVSFLVGGAIATFAFLKQSPLPPEVQVTVTETTQKPVEGGGMETKQVKVTSQIQDKENKL